MKEKKFKKQLQSFTENIITFSKTKMRKKQKKNQKKKSNYFMQSLYHYQVKIFIKMKNTCSI